MKPTLSACALSCSDPSSTTSASAARLSTMRVTADGVRAAVPIWPPFLIGRNSGPADRLATCCHAWNARTGQVRWCSPRGRPIEAPLPSWSVFKRPSRISSPSWVAVMSLTFSP